jgi:hypothetical protein
MNPFRSFAGLLILGAASAIAANITDSSLLNGLAWRSIGPAVKAEALTNALPVRLRSIINSST